MSEQCRDVAILRALAEQVMEAASQPKYAERIRLWTDHNSLRRTRPLVLASCGRWAAYEYEIIQYECVDPLYRDVEFQLRHRLFRDWVDDDWVLKPWVHVRAEFSDPGWGIQAVHTPSPEGRDGAYKLAAEPGITPADVVAEKLRRPRHVIDEVATAARFGRVQDAVGDIIPVVLDRTTPYVGFAADLSYSLGMWLGIERLMLHMCDDAAWLHELLAFMRDGVLAVQAEAEGAGDFNAVSQDNQAEPYAHETMAPVADGGQAERKQLWGFFAAQEFAPISPAMHEEFLFRYQMPIMEKAGLVAYGCCEDLTRKIGMLRQLGNLRRIAVSPWADVAACAEQIEDDYVLSWRPSPATMVCGGLDPAYVTKALGEGLAACAGCHVDITLKDIQTVQGEPERLKEWARLARAVAEEYA